MADQQHSPLAHYRDALAALPIGAHELPFLTQLNLRSDPESAAADRIAKALGGFLPAVPCTVARLDGVDVLWLGPDEWLLVAPASDRDALTETVCEAVAQDGAVTDVSAQRTIVRLTGPPVREVLARGCAIDLHPNVTPVDSCVQTLLAQTGVILVVNDEAASDLLVLVRASFAEYFADWLIDACSELR